MNLKTKGTCSKLLNCTERFMALEACITHLNVTSLDIHQIMNVCWPNGLYDAIIYIYNNGMKDFVTPAEELLGVLIKVWITQRDQNLYEVVL